MEQKFKLPWHYYVFPMWLSIYISMAQKIGIKATLTNIKVKWQYSWFVLKLKYCKKFKEKALTQFKGSPEGFDIYCRLLSGDFNITTEEMTLLLPKEDRLQAKIQFNEHMLTTSLGSRSRINEEIKGYRKELNKLKKEQDG